MSESIQHESEPSTEHKSLVTKKRVGIGVLILALVGVPVAIAQYHVTGADAATVAAAPASEVEDLTVTVTASDALLPGQVSDVTVSVENPNPFAVEVGTVTLDTEYMEPVVLTGDAQVVPAGDAGTVTYEFDDVVLIAPTADLDPGDTVEVTVDVDGVQYIGTVTPA